MKMKKLIGMVLFVFFNLIGSANAIEPIDPVVWAYPSVSNGELVCQFSIKPEFVNRLVSVTVEFPKAASRPDYVFDLVNDKILWDSRCRPLEFWSKSFGVAQEEDYYMWPSGFPETSEDFDNSYCFTSVFSEGDPILASAEGYSDLPYCILEQLDESSIAVVINEDGSAKVMWDLPTGAPQNYRVRVRDEDNKELYRGDILTDDDWWDIPAYDLRCLTEGATYRWLVRVSCVKSSVLETSYIVAEYTPGSYPKSEEPKGLEEDDTSGGSGGKGCFVSATQY